MTSIINNNVAGEITRLQKNMVAKENLAPSENWVSHCPSTNSALSGGKTSPQSLKSSRQTHIFFKPHPPSPFPPLFFCKGGGVFYELPPIPDVYLWCRLISTAGDWKIYVNTQHEKRRLFGICPWAQANLKSIILHSAFQCKTSN